MASLNCSAIDTAVDTLLHEHFEASSFWSAALPIGLVGGSVVLVLVGHLVIRTMASLIAASVTALVLFRSTDGVECLPRLLISGTGVVCSVLLVLCLLKAGLFVLGGAAFGAVAHFAFEAIPYNWTALDDVPDFQGRSLIYWGVVAISSLVGACIVYQGRRQTLILVTSILGGTGMSLGLSMAVVDDDVSPWTWVVTLATTSLVGVFAQTRLHRCLARRRHTHERKEERKEERTRTRRRILLRRSESAAPTEELVIAP